MRSIYNYIISCDNRYNNSKQIDNKELILNTEIFNHQHVNRIGIICSTPLANPLNLKEGDKVLLHHNVFRRWHNVKGVEKNSRSYLKEGEYIISQDQIFMYDKGDSWQAVEGFTFVKPLKSTNKYSLETEKPLIGPLPKINSANAAIKVVKFASTIVETALLKPWSIDSKIFFLNESSSLILSKIKTLASTAIPIVKTIPAIPGRVNVAPIVVNTAIILSLIHI